MYIFAPFWSMISALRNVFWPKPKVKFVAENVLISYMTYNRIDNCPLVTVNFP